MERKFTCLPMRCDAVAWAIINLRVEHEGDDFFREIYAAKAGVGDLSHTQRMERYAGAAMRAILRRISEEAEQAIRNFPFRESRERGNP